MILNTAHSSAHEAEGHWHKICLLVMLKLGVKTVEILNEDVEGLVSEIDMPCIMLEAGSTGLLVTVTTESEVRDIAAAKGIQLRDAK